MDILDFLSKYWSIVAFIGVVIMSWVRYESVNDKQDARIDNLESDVKEMRSDIKNNDAVVNILKQDLVEIKTILQFLKEKLDK